MIHYDKLILFVAEALFLSFCCDLLPRRYAAFSHCVVYFPIIRNIKRQLIPFFHSLEAGKVF
jgi:hypothetical protein